MYNDIVGIKQDPVRLTYALNTDDVNMALFQFKLQMFSHRRNLPR